MQVKTVKYLLSNGVIRTSVVKTKQVRKQLLEIIKSSWDEGVTLKKWWTVKTTITHQLLIKILTVDSWEIKVNPYIEDTPNFMVIVHETPEFTLAMHLCGSAVEFWVTKTYWQKTDKSFEGTGRNTACIQGQNWVECGVAWVPTNIPIPANMSAYFSGAIRWTVGQILKEHNIKT